MEQPIDLSQNGSECSEIKYLMSTQIKDKKCVTNGAEESYSDEDQIENDGLENTFESKIDIKDNEIVAIDEDKTQTNLSKPKKIKKKKQPFECNVCLMKYSQKVSLIRHMAKHEEYKFKCGTCSKGFNFPADLTRHMQSHDNDSKTKAFKCKLCDKEYYHKKNLVRHQISHTEKKIQCDICLKKFVENIDLIRHRRVHDKIKPFECEVCLKGFNFVSDLKRHAVSHKNNDFSCKRSLKRLTKKANLTGDKFTDNEHLLFECKACLMMFAHKSNLNRHLRIYHELKPFKCKMCLNEYYHRKNLTRHELIHNEKRFKCDKCLKKFKDNSGLKRHLRIHDELKPFECAECKKGFNYISDLTKHKDIHKDVIRTPFKCETCLNEFTYESDWKKHICSPKIKEKATQFKCDKCCKIFKFKSWLDTHIQIHSDLKPFECDKCSKQFKYPQVLKRHMEMHHMIPSTNSPQNKQIKCKRRKKTSIQKQDMANHIKTHDVQILMDRFPIAIKDNDSDKPKTKENATAVVVQPDYSNIESQQILRSGNHMESTDFNPLFQCKIEIEYNEVTEIDAGESIEGYDSERRKIKEETTDLDLQPNNHSQQSSFYYLS